MLFSGSYPLTAFFHCDGISDLRRRYRSMGQVGRIIMPAKFRTSIIWINGHFASVPKRTIKWFVAN